MLDQGIFRFSDHFRDVTQKATFGWLFHWSGNRPPPRRIMLRMTGPPWQADTLSCPQLDAEAGIENVAGPDRPDTLRG